MPGGKIGSVCFLAFLFLGSSFADDPSNRAQLDDSLDLSSEQQDQESELDLSANENPRRFNPSRNLPELDPGFNPSGHLLDVLRTDESSVNIRPLLSGLSLDTESEDHGLRSLDESERSGLSVSEGLGSSLYSHPHPQPQSYQRPNQQSNPRPNPQSYYPDSGSRLITPQEYLPAELDFGFKCQKQHEIYYVWGVYGKCLVCVCVKKRISLFHKELKPVCVSCEGCRSRSPLPLPPGPTTLLPLPPRPSTLPPLPPTPPTSRPRPTKAWTVPTTLPPRPQAVCDPLPTNQQFTNPLNPCQICICRQTYSVYGVVEVEIQCTNDPSCVIPPDATTLPPPYDPPTPVPLPSCANFPLNVVFPHPSLECVNCKCLAGPAGPQLYCEPNPECYPPLPLPPAPTTEVIPYPSPTPPRPGPLPGPSPHESCAPYTPNLPFEHPWDSCQQCVCKESRIIGIVNIEVNCYTKPECCIEYATPAPASPVIQDPICQYQNLNTPFLDPRDQCRVCSCELFGNVIVPSCYRSNRPECNAQAVVQVDTHIQVVFIEPKCKYQRPNQYFVVGCSSCVCEQVYYFVVAKCVTSTTCNSEPGSSVPGSSLHDHGQAYNQNSGGSLYDASQYNQNSGGALYDASQYNQNSGGALYDASQYNQNSGGSLYDVEQSQHQNSLINSQSQYQEQIQNSQYNSHSQYNAGNRETQSLVSVQENMPANLNNLAYQPYGYDASSQAEVYGQGYYNQQGALQNPSLPGGQLVLNPYYPAGQGEVTSSSYSEALANAAVNGRPYYSGQQNLVGPNYPSQYQQSYYEQPSYSETNQKVPAYNYFSTYNPFHYQPSLVAQSSGSSGHSESSANQGGVGSTYLPPYYPPVSGFPHLPVVPATLSDNSNQNSRLPGLKGRDKSGLPEPSANQGGLGSSYSSAPLQGVSAASGASANGGSDNSNQYYLGSLNRLPDLGGQDKSGDAESRDEEASKQAS